MPDAATISGDTAEYVADVKCRYTGYSHSSQEKAHPLIWPSPAVDPKGEMIFDRVVKRG